MSSSIWTSWREGIRRGSDFGGTWRKLMHVPPISGVSKVINAFGCFPTFHDGEILDLQLVRNSTPDTDVSTASIRFTLHGWEMTSEVMPDGYFRLTKHHLVRFRFDHVDQVKISCFNHQNVISELFIEGISEPKDHALIRVELDGCYGVEAAFRAVTGTVEDVIPCSKDGRPL